MARSKDLKVNIIGDADKLDKEVRRSTNSLDRLGKQTRLTGSMTSKGFAAMRVGATGAAAGIAGLAIAGKRVIDVAADIDESLSKNRVLFGQYSKGIDAFSKQSATSLGISRAAALEATGTFGNLFTALNIAPRASAKMSVSLVKLAGDMASFNNASPEETLDAIRSGLVGETEPLRRFGVNLNDATLRAEALRMGLVKTTKESLEPQTKALAVNSLLFKQTEKAQGDFARTSNGAANQQRILNAQFSDAQAELGQKLLPTFTKGIRTVNKFVGEMQSGTGQGGRFADTLKEVWTETKPIVQWIGRATKNVAIFAAKHPDLLKLAGGVLAVGAAVKTMRFISAVTGFSSLLKGGRVAAKGLRRIFASAGTTAGGAAADNVAASFASSASTGKMNRAGKKVGRLAGRGLVVGAIAGFVAFLPELVRKIDDGIIAAPFRFGESIGKKIRGAVGGALKAINPFGDGLGKIGKGKLGSSKGAGNLMGASGKLAPLAAVGARFGLSVSSGGRPGSITSSGNVSYHSSGEAIDMSGPPAGMMRTFKALKASVGGRLAELIYTPGGIGIKNGRPHRYTGKVAADHHDHVHVAMDLGRPGIGIGDGYGKGQIKALWTRAGGNPKVANLAAAVALAESGGESNAKNENSNGSIDRGLWQINSIHGKLSTFDPIGNARAAVKISSGGKNWRPWVAYKSGAYRRFLSASDGPGGTNEPSRETIDKRIEANKDRIDALRDRLGKVPAGKQGASRRKAIQRQIRGLTSANRKLGDIAEDIPTAEERREAAERSGSRAVNRIVGRYGKGITAATRSATELGVAIEGAGTAYGQREREFGLTEENLGTPEGRARRTSELKALAVEKGKILKGQKARAGLLQRAISKREGLIKRLRKARDRAKGAKRAKMSERIRPIMERQAADKAELVSLGFAIRDTELDIGDLAKEASEVAGTPDEEVPPDTRAVDRLGQFLSDVELQERAGILSPEQANAIRIQALQMSLQGAGGPLNERQRWEVMAQLRDAQKAATEAQEEAARTVAENTAAIHELKASIDAQIAFGDRVSAITSFEAVRAMADTMTGQLGARVSAKSRMPGSGALARF